MEMNEEKAGWTHTRLSKKYNAHEDRKTSKGQLSGEIAKLFIILDYPRWGSRRNRPENLTDWVQGDTVDKVLTRFDILRRGNSDQCSD